MTMPLLFSLALKGTAVLVLGGSAAWLLRRSHASLRHGIWAATFAALLAVPVLSAVGPAWRVAMLPNTSPGVTESHPAATQIRGGDPSRSALAHRVGPGAGAAAAPHIRPTPTVSTAAIDAVVRAARGTSLWAWIVVLWGVGAVVVASVWLRAFVLARRLVRETYSLAAPEWAAHAARAASQSGLMAPVRLLWSDALSVPIAWGFGHTAVVLPPQSETWDAERLDAVLLHEMAHLRRRDAWTQVLAQAALAVHWPNPLAWMAYRRFLDDREQACDDAVLRIGARATDYASHLVAVAREISASRTMWAVASMAGRGELETRVRAVLDGRRPRGVLGHRAAGVVLVLATGVGVPLAAFHPVEASANRVAAAVPPMAPRSSRSSVAPSGDASRSGGEVGRTDVAAADEDSTGEASRVPTLSSDASAQYSNTGTPLVTAASPASAHAVAEQVEPARVAGRPTRELPTPRQDPVREALHRVEVAHLSVQTANLQVGDAQRALGAALDAETRAAALSAFEASQRTLSSALAALTVTHQDLAEAQDEASASQ